MGLGLHGSRDKPLLGRVMLCAGERSGNGLALMAPPGSESSQSPPLCRERGRHDMQARSTSMLTARFRHQGNNKGRPRAKRLFWMRSLFHLSSASCLLVAYARTTPSAVPALVSLVLCFVLAIDFHVTLIRTYPCAPSARGSPCTRLSLRTWLLVLFMLCPFSARSAFSLHCQPCTFKPSSLPILSSTG